MVVKEFIDSERVNFLIWRYLLESNYRETAAKLQKEWRVREPHRECEFASHVKSQALVKLINRGLLYSALERQLAQPELSQDELDATTNLPQVGIFGPLITQPPADTVAGFPDVALGGAGTGAGARARGRDETQEIAPALPAVPPPPAQPVDDADASRKRSQQPLINGSPVKRPRLSNGYENGHDAGVPAAGTAMDVDPPEDHHQQVQDNHAYPSPQEGEQVTTPIPHTEGPEQATQVDKVEELLPDTTFIRLGEARRADDAASGTADDAKETPTNPPILLQCEWNPKDPSVLAAAGTDGLARVWTVPRYTTAEGEPGQDPVFSQGLALLDPDTPPTSTVTALAWTSDGTTLALAIDLGKKAAINICSSDGILLQSMEPSEPPIVKLAWNPSNTALLSISPDKGGALVTVYYAAAGKSDNADSSLSYLIPDHDILGTLIDAAWTSDSEFLLSGGDMLVSLYCDDSAIKENRKFETRKDDSFTQVLFDWRSKLAATSSDKGVLDLWDESGGRKSIVAHQSAITTLAWQPLPPTHPNISDERLIATGGEDCAIFIWNAKVPDSKPKCSLTLQQPIVRLAFTPDGAFLAAATSAQVMIWKVGNFAVPRAMWSRPSHSGWLSPKVPSDSEEEDEHCLCWDASGHKLAYGSNSRLAVINFNRQL